MRRWRNVLYVLVGLIVAAGAWGAIRQRNASVTRPSARPSVPADARAPDSARVRVQVLNATNVTGLARRATMVLRDHGFDVVETGNTKGPLDTTLVLDLSGHPDWAQRVATVMAPARVQARHDTSRYLDIAVVLGTTWRPPAKPFYP